MAIQPQADLKNAKKVFFFAAGQTDGNAAMKNILGGKGANLAEMTSLGIPVPPGFTISTEVCVDFYKHGQRAASFGHQRDRRSFGRSRRQDRQEIRRCEESACWFQFAQVRPRFDAGHDGYDSESRS